MVLAPNAGTGLTWYNYNRFVDTATGKDTLHERVWIAYQVLQERNSNALDTIEREISPERSEVETSLPRKVNGKKRRRTYEPTGLRIESYRKIIKFNSSTFLPNDDHRRKEIEDVGTIITRTWKLDILWMANYLIKKQSPTPLWA